MKSNEALSLTLKLAEQTLRCLPRSNFVDGLIDHYSNHRYDSIIDCKLPDFGDSFPSDYFAYNLMRKYPFPGRDRKSIALRSFEEYELSCKKTNERLSAEYVNNFDTWDAIRYLREKIHNCLGSFDWNLAERGFSHGPGATTRLKSAEGDIYFKFRGKPETTLNNLPLAQAAIASIPLWFGSIGPKTVGDMCHVVCGSKVTTVPKDGKTDRTIAIEPCMNMYIQKGIGKLIRGRLSRVEVNLNDQSHNQRLAAVAYKEGLATIDLSAASDTVSSILIDLLLPGDWASALKQCRSPRYQLGSQIKTFEKFSTMGNGYTFELESLIFWAITQLSIDESFVADRRFGVYGDDLICHSYAVPRLLHWLSVFGFKPNTQKSFSEGPFFESCGKHFYKGCDVTPVYVKESVCSAARMCWYFNSIARWINRTSTGELSFDLTSDMQALFDLYKPQLDRFCIPIPDGVGDSGVISNPTIVKTRKKLSYHYQHGFDYISFIRVRINTRSRDPSDMPYLLRGLHRLRDVSDYVSRLLYSDDISELGIIENTIWNESHGWTSSWPNLQFSFQL